jgi:hypothetical protein
VIVDSARLTATGAACALNRRTDSSEKPTASHCFGSEMLMSTFTKKIQARQVRFYGRKGD